MDSNFLINMARDLAGIYAEMFIVWNAGFFVLNKIKLQKISKYDGRIIKNAPFTNEKKLEDLKNKINEEKIKDLIPLIQKIENYVSEDDLKTFYENLSTVKVKRNVELLFGTVGSYDYTKNKISYSKKSAIEHELLHMASSVYKKESDESYSGFTQQKGRFAYIGRGINEGYTEYLSSKIFGSKVTAYKKFVKFARLIELFFDNPKDMEKLYFNHNLPGLIYHLEKYAPRKEIIDLILRIDKIELYSTFGFNIPFLTYDSVKIQMTLYNWFKRMNKDPEKLQKFEEILCENKIAKILVNKQNMKLCRENIYTNYNQRRVL